MSRGSVDWAGIRVKLCTAQDFGQDAFDMTDDWDFYFTRVDDQLASIFVDLGAVKSAPLAGLPHRAVVLLRMNDPRPDGLSSNAEFEMLGRIEKHLEREVAGEDAAYVGRCTSDSCRDFYFYVADPAAWSAKARACMSAFPDYRHAFDICEQRDWSTYREFLFPGPEDMRRIQDRRLCDALERHGDPLVASRAIDHWAYFPDADARAAFVAGAEELGFAVRALAESKETTQPFGAQVWRTDVPNASAIDEVTLPLFRLAVRCGGEYDGWETLVLRADR